MRYVLAIIACLVIVIVWVTISGLMKWNIFGGLIVQGIGIVILVYTWRAIVKKGEKNNQIDIQKEDDLNSSKKDGNTHNISRSDNAPEIVSKPFKTKIIKQDSDMENTIGDEELYLTATKEVEGKGLDEALWAKCLAIFKGDEKKAKYDYIEKRVAILRQEEVDRIAEEERIAREKIEEKERIAREKVEVERKKKLAKEIEETKKKIKRKQVAAEKMQAEIQERQDQQERIRFERQQVINKRMGSFLKKRWRLLVAVLLAIIAYNLITPDDPKTKTKEVSEVKTEIKEVATKTKEVSEVKTEIKEVATKTKEVSAESSDNIHSVNKKTECPKKDENLEGVNLQSIDLKNKDLECANFKGANLENANLSNANLRKANFEGARLEFVNLEGANLEMANLKGAHLHSANLKGANLEGADLSGIYSKGSSGIINMENINMENANLKKANLKTATLWRANLKGANLEDANLTYANLEEADLSNANLKGANLEGVNLTYANLKKANLSQAELKLANLLHTNLIGANLLNVNLKGANLKGAYLSNANLTGVDLTGAKLNNITMDGTIFCNTKTPWGWDNSGCNPITPDKPNIQESSEKKTLIHKGNVKPLSPKAYIEQQYNIGVTHFEKDTEEGYNKSFSYFKAKSFQ